jgi:hypothetical protein
MPERASEKTNEFIITDFCLLKSQESMSIRNGMDARLQLPHVTPAKAGVQWIPAFAGMTVTSGCSRWDNAVIMNGRHNREYKNQKEMIDSRKTGGK